MLQRILLIGANTLNGASFEKRSEVTLVILGDVQLPVSQAFKKDLFIYLTVMVTERERERQIERGSDLLSADSYAKWPQWRRQSQAEAGSFIHVSCVVAGDQALGPSLLVHLSN